MSKKSQHIRVNSHWQLIKPIYQQEDIFHQEKNKSLLSVLIIKEFLYIILEEEANI